MLLRYVLTLLEDLFVDSAAKVGPMFTKKSLNDSETSLSSETIFIVNKNIIDRGRFITFACK